MRLLACAILLFSLQGCDNWDAKPPEATRAGEAKIDIPESLVQTVLSIRTKAVTDALMAKYRTEPLKSGSTGEISAKLLVEDKTTIQKAVDYVETPFKAAGCAVRNVVSQCPQQVARKFSENCIKHLRLGKCFKVVVTTEMAPCSSEVRECWPQINEVIKTRIEPAIDIKEALLPTSVVLHYDVRLLDAEITALTHGIKISGGFKIGISADIKQGILSVSQTIKGALACDSNLRVGATATVGVTANPSLDVDLQDFNIDIGKICIPGAIQLADLSLANPSYYITKDLLGPPVKRALTDILNDQLKKLIGDKLDFRDALIQLGHQTAEPVKLGKDLWLQINPEKIWLSQFEALGTGDANELQMKVAAGARPNVVLGTMPGPPASDVPIQAGLREDINNVFFLAATGAANLDEVNGQLLTIVNDALQEHAPAEILVAQGVNVYQSGARLVIGLVLATSPTAAPLGTVYLAAEPYVDEETRTIRVRNAGFDLDSRRVLLKTASWLLSGAFEKIIEKRAKFDYGGALASLEETAGLRPESSQGSGSLTPAMAVFKTGHFRQKMKTLEIDGTVKMIEVKRIWVADNALRVLAQAGGTLNIGFAP